mgnify:CR=1 FL=1
MQHAYRILLAASLLALAPAIWAGQTYKLRVDGLACAYCAYGIEKKFMRTDGVQAVDIDFEQGLVLVSTEDGVHFAEEDLRRWVNDAGFTLRGVTLDSATNSNTDPQ